jgi:periplasmic protein CpxP/Spy
MNNTGRNKILLLIIVALVITNLGMVWYFTKPEKEEKPKSRADRMTEYVKKELNFSDEQAKEYLALRQKRDSMMKPLNLDMRQARLEMIALLNQPNAPDSVLKAAFQKIGDKQVPIEMEYYEHFKRVQALCKPDQLPRYDSMLIKMVYRNTGDGQQK